MEINNILKIFKKLREKWGLETNNITSTGPRFFRTNFAINES